MPRRETEANRIAEREVVVKLGGRWAASPIFLPRWAVADAVLVRDDAAVALVEVKVRDRFYDTLMISMRKISDLQSLGSLLKVPVFLVLQNGEGKVRFWEIDTAQVERVQTGGRTDRGDASDVEPCCFIPMGRFMELR